MTTLVIGPGRGVAFVVARLLGRNAVTVSDLAVAADESTLSRFPPPAWCESQEASLFVLERIKDVRWRSMIDRATAEEGVDPELLECLVSQAYALGLGRKLEVIRLCLAVLDAPRIKLVSDLPVPLLEAFVAECNGQVIVAPVVSGLMRLLGAIKSVGYGLGRHMVRLVRLAKLMGLPPKPAYLSSYIAWIGALPAEVANNASDKQSLPEFLDEARSEAGVEEVMIQGARPGKLPSGMPYGEHLPTLRYRPSWNTLAQALFEQVRQTLRELRGLFDNLSQSLINPLIADLPGYRLWFAEDPPAAVLYSNAMIGGEPPVSLLRRRFGVPSMMVFYSANVSYGHPPARFAGPVTRLEPEIRFIAADRITMWSDMMTAAFRDAGYSRTRLIETGPVVFARQQGFKPTSRFVIGGNGPVRIGLFDVSVQRPQRRFELGYGQLIYNADYSATFFRDIFEAARARYAGRFIIVRKLKRVLVNAVHAEDIDFSQLPAVTIVTRDPAESLWKVLESVDLVLCMPFTSLAYLADEYGIPAAYYDPSGTVVRSPLGGRASLLSGRAALDSWLAAPICSAPRRSDELIGPKVVRAAIHHEWNRAGSCYEGVARSSSLPDHQFDAVGPHGLSDGPHA